MLKERLLIFTRYPEPGKTKTRMIPALGATGAAQLQQQMTEHTLRQVKQLKNISVAVYFAGGSKQLMSDWLGDNFIFCEQAQGDLGTKMSAAFVAAFADDMERVIIIGIDCPDIKSNLLTKAFNKLKNFDLVLGPADDGGYYLIGLSSGKYELFIGINWGTATVLQETLEIAQRLDISYACLPVLSDVDRPEDLPIWEKYAIDSE